MRALYRRQLLMLLCTVLRRRMQETLLTWLLAMLNWMQFSICAPAQSGMMSGPRAIQTLHGEPMSGPHADKLGLECTRNKREAQ